VSGEPIDEARFETLYRSTAAPLRAYVVRVMGYATHADDIVQDAYLRLLRAPPPTCDPDQLRAYLFRIASNLVHDYWRHQRRERGACERRTSAPATVTPDLPLRVDMARLFEQLRPQQRQLMWFAYVEGADHREIAAALGLGERSVRVLLHRARRKLATLLRQRETVSGERR
jgi:RNA polymerase sigma-70 factor (ECF subfamily)